MFIFLILLSCNNTSFKIKEKNDQIERDKKNNFINFLALVKNGEIDTVKSMINKSLVSNLNETDNYNFTALMYASTEEGKEDMMAVLIESGALVNAKNSNGRTALMEASLVGNVSAVKLLIKNGANLDEVDNDSKTALNIAEIELQKTDDEKIKNKFNEMVKLLNK